MAEAVDAVGTARTASKCCKIPGCGASLEACSKYAQKKRICIQHLKALSVECPDGSGTQMRFCQQCGRLEALSLFQGMKRSCRSSLRKRRAQSDQKAKADGPATGHSMKRQCGARPAATVASCQLDQDAGCDERSMSDVIVGGVVIAAAAAAPAVAMSNHADLSSGSASSSAQSAHEAAAAVIAEAWCSSAAAAPAAAEAVQPGPTSTKSKAANSDHETAEIDLQLMAVIEHELLAAAAAAPPMKTGTLQQPPPALSMLHSARSTQDPLRTAALATAATAGCIGHNATPAAAAVQPFVPLGGAAPAAAPATAQTVKLAALAAKINEVQQELLMLQQIRHLQQQLSAERQWLAAGQPAMDVLLRGYHHAYAPPSATANSSAAHFGHM